MRMALDTIGQVLSILWAHKLRSFLTMFGIAWGVGSLLFLVGVGEGFRSGQRKNMATIGEDVIFVWGGQIPVVAGQNQDQRSYYLTYKDYLDIKNEATLVGDVAPRGGPRRHSRGERFCHGQRIREWKQAEF